MPLIEVILNYKKIYVGHAEKHSSPKREGIKEDLISVEKKMFLDIFNISSRFKMGSEKCSKHSKHVIKRILCTSASNEIFRKQILS